MTVSLPADVQARVNAAHMRSLYACKPPGGFLSQPRVFPWTPGANLTCTDGHQFIWTPEEKRALQFLSLRSRGLLPSVEENQNLYDKTISDLQKIAVGMEITPYHLLRFMIPCELQTLLSFRPAEGREPEKALIENLVGAEASVFFDIIGHVDSYLRDGNPANIEEAIRYTQALKMSFDVMLAKCPALLLDSKTSDAVSKLKTNLGTLLYALENRNSAFVQLIVPNKVEDLSQTKSKMMFFNLLYGSWGFNCRILERQLKLQSRVLKSIALSTDKIGPTSKLSIAQRNRILQKINVLKRRCHADTQTLIGNITLFEKGLNTSFPKKLLGKADPLITEGRVSIDDLEEDLQNVRALRQGGLDLRDIYLSQMKVAKDQKLDYETALSGILESSGLNDADCALLKDHVDDEIGLVYGQNAKDLEQVFRPSINYFTNFLIHVLSGVETCISDIMEQQAAFIKAIPTLAPPPAGSLWVSPLHQTIMQMMDAVEELENSPCMDKQAHDNLHRLMHLMLFAFQYPTPERLEAISGFVESIKLQKMGDAEYRAALTNLVTIRKFQMAFQAAYENIKSSGCSPSMVLPPMIRAFNVLPIEKSEVKVIKALSDEEQRYLYKVYGKLSYFMDKLAQDSLAYIDRIHVIKRALMEGLESIDETSAEAFKTFKAEFDAEECMLDLDQLTLELSMHHKAIKSVQKSHNREKSVPMHYRSVLADLNVWVEILNKQQNWYDSLVADGNIFSMTGAFKRIHKRFQQIRKMDPGSISGKSELAFHGLVKDIDQELRGRSEDIVCCYETVFPSIGQALKCLSNYEQLIPISPVLRRKAARRRKARPVSPPQAVPKHSESAVEASVSAEAAPVVAVAEVLHPEPAAIPEPREEERDLMSLMCKLNFSEAAPYVQNFMQRTLSDMASYVETVDELLAMPPSHAIHVNQQLVNRAGLLLEGTLKILLASAPFDGEEEDHPLWRRLPDDGKLKNSHDLQLLLKEVDARIGLRGKPLAGVSLPELRHICKELNYVVPRYSRYPTAHTFNPVSACLMDLCDSRQETHRESALECRRWAKEAMVAAKALIGAVVDPRHGASRSVDTLSPVDLLSVRPARQAAASAQDCQKELKEAHALLRKANYALGVAKDKVLPSSAKPKIVTHYNASTVSMSALEQLLTMTAEERKSNLSIYADSLLLHASLSVEHLLLATITYLQVSDGDASGPCILDSKSVEFNGRKRLLRNTHWLDEFLSIVIENIPDEKKEPLRQYAGDARMLKMFLGHLNHYPSSYSDEPIAKSMAALRQYKKMIKIASGSEGFYADREFRVMKQFLGDDGSAWEAVAECRGNQVLEEEIFPLCRQSLELCRRLLDLHIELSTGSADKTIAPGVRRPDVACEA